jgi:hypothetical protein
MAYILFQVFGRKDKSRRKEALESFSTEPEAVKRACALLAADVNAEFLVQDENGKVVTNDLEIRTRCPGVPISI